MTEASVITDAMRAEIGKESEPVTFEIDKTACRMFARAAGYTDPLFFDEEYARSKGYRGIPAPVGFLGHASHLYEELTALENLSFVTMMRGLRAERRRLLDLLEGVGLAHQAHRRVRSFSAGMKRRLGLARLRLTEPALLLVDEPYAGLDQSGGALFETVVHEALGRGGTVVMATHQLARAHEVASRVAILAGQRLAHFGRTDETDLDGLRRVYARVTEEPASLAPVAASAASAASLDGRLAPGGSSHGAA